MASPMLGAVQRESVHHSTFPAQQAPVIDATMH